MKAGDILRITRNLFSKPLVVTGLALSDVVHYRSGEIFGYVRLLTLDGEEGDLTLVDGDNIEVISEAG